MQAWRMVAVAGGVAAVLAGSVATASASAAHPATVRPMGVGYANSVAVATAIRSAPSSSTFYVGTAHPGDNVADICWIPGADSGIWDLVLERTGAGGDHFGNTVGYILEADLRDGGQNQHTQCPAPGSAPGNSVNANTTMRSAPTTGAFAVGTAVPSDRLTLYCWIADGNNVPWDITVQEAGRGGDHLQYAASMIPNSVVLAGVPGAAIPPCGQS